MHLKKMKMPKKQQNNSTKKNYLMKMKIQTNQMKKKKKDYMSILHKVKKKDVNNF